MQNKTLLILCFLGDPMLPPVSVPNTGGYNVDMKELLDFLSGTDWNCVVITNTSIYLQECETTWAKNIRIYRISVEDAHINQQDYLQSIFPRVLDEVIELCCDHAIRPNLIHSYYWFSGRLAQYLSTRLGIPFVHSAVSLSMDKINSGVKPRSLIQTTWEREFLSAARAVFVITAQERDLLLQYYPVHPERVLIVGRGVSEEFRQPQHDAEGVPAQIAIPDEQRLQIASSAIPASTLWWNSGAYLYMGRLREIKGIDLIIRAWFRLYRTYQARTPPLWIVGGSPAEISELRDQLDQEVPDLMQAEQSYKLVWWGYLSPAGISTLMLKSSVLLMHSRFEAGGRIVLEAMSSRKPVIATPTGFAIDYIQNWINGFLVEYGDADTLTQRMELFIRQPLLSNAMGNNAYQTFLRMEAQWDCYPRHLRIYEAISEEPEKPLSEQLRMLPALEPITDFVKRGLLTAYPYQLPDKGFVERGLSQFSEGPFIPLDTGTHSNLWRVLDANTPYIVKQFYSTINEHALWNEKDTEPVLLASERYARAVCSSHIDGIAPVTKKDPALFLILMPEKAQCVPSEQHYADILHLLDRVGASQNHEGIPERPIGAPQRFATLSGRWNDMEKAVVSSLCSEWIRFWKKRKRSLATYQDLSTIGTPAYCTVYGASAMHHLCMDGTGGLLLYPSDRMLWGEKGFDQARLWLEWEWTFGGTPDVDTRARYELARSSIGLSDLRFKSWCLCLLCQGIQRSFQLKTGEVERLIEHLDALLAKEA